MISSLHLHQELRNKGKNGVLKAGTFAETATFMEHKHVER